MVVEGCGSDSVQGDVRFAEVMGPHVEWQANSITITGEDTQKCKKALMRQNISGKNGIAWH